MPGPAKATFEAVTGKPGAKSAKPGAQFAVMFNPASLKVSLTNKLQDDKNGGAQGGAKQSTQGTTSKLETELIFDTTETGTDVREAWGPLRKLALTPKGHSPKPPQVRFRWARFTFTGVIETLNETLDFWSSEGVPLRASVQITLQGFGLDEPDKKTQEKPLTAALSKPAANGRGVIDVADDAGDPRGGRSLAAANGVEDMRAAPDGPLTVPASVDLKPPAAFASGADDGGGGSASAGFAAGASAGAGLDVGAGAGASAGFSAGASAGFDAGASAGFSGGASAGFSAGASAGFSAGASAGFGASASAGFGGSATAGVSASAGAFAGLGASKTTLSVTLDPERLLPPPSAPLLGSGAQFDVTGRLVAGGSAGLSADVRGGVRIV